MIEQILRFLDPLALLIVFGGSLLAALLRGGWSAFGPALRALGALARTDPEEDRLAAVVAVGQVEAIATAKSVCCADRVSPTARFLRDAVRRLSAAKSGAAYAAWAEGGLAARARRHGAAIAFWRDLADAAPAMGMVATVLGLVRMFAAMDDPARIGAPMATALVATLWGILVANLLAGPIADRLERLSEAELAWQRRTLEQLTALARAELDTASAAVRRVA